MRQEELGFIHLAHSYYHKRFLPRRNAGEKAGGGPHLMRTDAVWTEASESDQAMDPDTCGVVSSGNERRASGFCKLQACDPAENMSAIEGSIHKRVRSLAATRPANGL